MKTLQASRRLAQRLVQPNTSACYKAIHPAGTSQDHSRTTFTGSAARGALFAVAAPAHSLTPLESLEEDDKESSSTHDEQIVVRIVLESSSNFRVNCGEAPQVVDR